MSIGKTATQYFTFGSSADPFRLRAGGSLDQVTLAYETYGTLNVDKSNGVLLFHALTGTHHAAGVTTEVAGTDGRWVEEMHDGWWDAFIGPGKALDTDRFFVICVNYLGGCYGSTGPASISPRTEKPYGSSFPDVGLADIVDSQVELIRHLGIERLHAVVGGSTGGVCAMSLATRYPDLVEMVIPIAAGANPTPLQIIHNFEQINAIQNDPDFAGGDYYDGPHPDSGLRLARMIGHKTFVSLQAMQRRAREEIVRRGAGPGSYTIQHPLESYMWHQGTKFVKRFDANSYLRLMSAWQQFDLVGEAEVAGFEDLFTACKHQRYMIFSIDSDVCFYAEEQSELMRLLALADVPARRITVHSDKGHDSFLLEPALYTPHLSDTLLNEWSE